MVHRATLRQTFRTLQEVLPRGGPNVKEVQVRVKVLFHFFSYLLNFSLLLLLPHFRSYYVIPWKSKLTEQ